MKVNVTWQEKMFFIGEGESGHEVGIDAAESVGGSNRGARPTELLLNAVGGCTGIDILSILQKMRLEVKSFYMEIEGERAEEHPRKFLNIHIHYYLEGPDLPYEKVKRAVDLSRDKYCSVAHSLSASILTSFSINGVKQQ